MSTFSMPKFRVGLFAAVLAILPLSPAMHAQSDSVEPLGQFNVPFEFDSGSHHFAAGLYTVSWQATNTISIRGASGTWFTLMLPEEEVQPSRTGKVVFRKSGSRYVLSEIWVSGEMIHFHRVPSKAERRLSSAKNAAPPDSVEVAALEPAR